MFNLYWKNVRRVLEKCCWHCKIIIVRTKKTKKIIKLNKRNMKLKKQRNKIKRKNEKMEKKR